MEKTRKIGTESEQAPQREEGTAKSSASLITPAVPSERYARWRGRLNPDVGRNLASRFAVVGVWVLFIVVFGALRPSEFLTTTNFTSMFSTQAPLVLLSLSLVVTLTVGEFDLSIAGSFGLAATVTAQLNAVDNVNWIVAIILGLAASCAAGGVTAFLVVWVGVDSVVATLGMGTLLIGIAEGFSHLTTIGGISQQISTIMTTSIGGLWLAFYYALICVALIWYLAGYARVGRHMLFVGQGREVARLSGVRVGRVRAAALVGGAICWREWQARSP